ncbi:MAG TPA: hypothetical protein VEP69_02210, partial [Thermodesulfovibrionales bacterium]|nr:hypothetical protein [Thermodesulfovibrionales bacterium]
EYLRFHKRYREVYKKYEGHYAADPIKGSHNATSYTLSKSLTSRTVSEKNMIIKRRYNPSIDSSVYSAYHERTQNRRKEDIETCKNVVKNFLRHAMQNSTVYLGDGNRSYSLPKAREQGEGADLRQ